MLGVGGAIPVLAAMMSSTEKPCTKRDRCLSTRTSNQRSGADISNTTSLGCSPWQLHIIFLPCLIWSWVGDARQ